MEAKFRVVMLVCFSVVLSGCYSLSPLNPANQWNFYTTPAGELEQQRMDAQLSQLQMNQNSNVAVDTAWVGRLGQ